MDRQDVADSRDVNLFAFVVLFYPLLSRLDHFVLCDVQEINRRS